MLPPINAGQSTATTHFLPSINSDCHHPVAPTIGSSNINQQPFQYQYQHQSYQLPALSIRPESSDSNHRLLLLNSGPGYAEIYRRQRRMNSAEERPTTVNSTVIDSSINYRTPRNISTGSSTIASRNKAVCSGRQWAIPNPKVTALIRRQFYAANGDHGQSDSDNDSGEHSKVTKSSKTMTTVSRPAKMAAPIETLSINSEKRDASIEASSLSTRISSSGIAINRTTQTTSHIKTATNAASQTDSANNHDDSSQISAETRQIFIERINSLETRIQQITTTHSTKDHLLHQIAQQASSTAVESTTASCYHYKLLLLRYLINSGSGTLIPASARRLIEALEWDLGLLNGTKMHRSLHLSIRQYMFGGRLKDALSLMRTVYKQLESMGRESIVEQFEDCQYQVERLLCLQLIQLGQADEAFIVLNSRLFGYIRKLERLGQSFIFADTTGPTSTTNNYDNIAGNDENNDVDEHKSIMQDYDDLCLYLARSYPQCDFNSLPLHDAELIHHLVDSESAEVDRRIFRFLNMNWQETMERFWRPVDEFHRHKYGHSTASDNNSIVKPSKRYIAFLADYFTDRSLTLNGFPSTPDAIINQAFVLQSIHQQLSDKGYQASDGCSVIKSAANSPPSTGRKPSPSLSQVEPNSSSASVIQSTQQLNSVELIEQQKRSDWPTVTSKTGQQLRLSIDNIPAIEKFSQSAQDLQPTADWLQFNLIGGGPLTIPETASVESMDVCIDPQNGHVIVGISYKERKAISLIDTNTRHLLFTHPCKRAPAQCLAFYKQSHHANSPINNTPRPWLLYAEYKDTYLLDWKQQTVLRKWSLHRNIILHLDFLPPRPPSEVEMRLGRVSVNDNQILAISVAFDHSLKLWDCGATDARVIDKLHSPDNQPFTAFCVRRKYQSDNFEIFIAQERGLFKIYKMRGLGSLILVRQFSVDSMRYFPKVTLLSANPVNPAQYLVGCERDNRLLVIDSERGEIIRQISSRGFCMDKRSTAQFSPDGQYVVAGSVSSSQSTVFSCPTPPSQPTPINNNNSSTRTRQQHRQLKAVNQQGVSSDAKPLLKQRDEPINEIGTFIWHVQSNKLVRHIDGGNENDEISGDIRPLAPLSTHCKWITLNGSERRLLTIGADLTLRTYLNP